MHIDNKKKDILVLVEGPTQGLDDTRITAEAKYSINFSRWQEVFITMEARVFCLQMPQKYIGSK